MSTTLNPEIAALRERIEAQGKELAEIRGSVHQLDKIIGATVRQSIWQLIALIVTLLLSLGGGLAYQTNMMEKRIEQVEKRIEQSEKNMTGRFEDLEKNITARFDDLKQEVRAQRQ